MHDISRPAASRWRRAGVSLPALALALPLMAASGARGGAWEAPSSAASVRRANVPLPPGWHVRTLEHVDLWLHGFAMLTSDTGHVTFFGRGYSAEIARAKQAKGITTQLDENRKTLSARFATNPALTNGQFVAMYFPSLQEIERATDLFIRSSGNPRMASDRETAEEIALLAANFPQPADRDWLRLFVKSLKDEDTRFYHAYWSQAQAARGAAFAAFNQQWTSRFYPALSRFLNNTQQARGDLLLSLPLGGEGRTIHEGKQSNMIAVAYPATVESAPEALFVFAHESVAELVSEAINDNTTPAEKRSGVTVGYVGNGAVRSGALLLQHVTPELVPDYMRFYLRMAGRPVPSDDPATAFAAAFPIPPVILTAVTRQIELVLSGI